MGRWGEVRFATGIVDGREVPVARVYTERGFLLSLLGFKGTVRHYLFISRGDPHWRCTVRHYFFISRGDPHWRCVETGRGYGAGTQLFFWLMTNWTFHQLRGAPEFPLKWEPPPPARDPLKVQADEEINNLIRKVYGETEEMLRAQRLREKREAQR